VLLNQAKAKQVAQPREHSVRVGVVNRVESCRERFPLQQFTVCHSRFDEGTLVLVECLGDATLFLSVTKRGSNRHHHVLNTLGQQCALNVRLPQVFHRA